MCPKSIVDALPERQIDIIQLSKSGDMDEGAMKCMVCLNEYEDKESVRTMPCMHYFHKDCIDKWLLSRGRQCPICKFDIGKNYNAIEMH